MAPLATAAPRSRPVTARRAAVLLATLSASLLAWLAVATGPADAASQRCEGVWVVVDASELGGPATTRCATTDAAIDGVEVLTRAGHTVSDVPGQPGFVCRIDRRPDPCPGTPPQDAYWSYWQAEPGGSWRYSNLGASSRQAEPGSVDGWAFGAGDPPSSPPPAPASSADPEPERDTSEGDGPDPREDRDGRDGPDDGDGSGDDETAQRSPGGDGDAAEARDRDDGSASSEASVPSDDGGSPGGGRSGADPEAGPDREAAAGANDTATSAADPDDADGPENAEDAEDTDDRPVPRGSPAAGGDGSGPSSPGAASTDAGAEATDGTVTVGGDRGEGGSLAPVAVGGGLLAGLAGTAAWTARRRSRDATDLAP